jgi:Predicted S-adenosylmethionine-dependent methyltransferase
LSSSTIYFDKGEVSEIWITFPDPQMKKVTKRLTSTRFMQLYLEILNSEGLVHLKCDSNFLFTYTSEMVKANNFPVLFKTEDLYHSDINDDVLLSIQTYYEQQWIERGISIKYIKFQPQQRDPFVEPDVEIERDSYRSYNRSKRSGNAMGK